VEFQVFTSPNVAMRVRANLLQNLGSKIIPGVISPHVPTLVR
jgi:hypothetical protein